MAKRSSSVQKSVKKKGGQLPRKGTMSAASNQVIARVRGLAWTGRHAAAIDLAAQALELLNDYFALMFDAIAGHGGTLNQMVGDGLMAVFGAPMPSENRREQAVRAALEMLDLLDGFNQEQAARNKVQIGIGIGIASGLVIAGYTGTQHRATYTCIGDTVNLASRIESHTRAAARPILIDLYTREGLSEDIQVEALGPVRFKGKEQAVKIFAVQRG